MHRFWEYLIFFIVIGLLQVLLFDNVNLSIYVTPLIYVAFIILLPVRTPPILLLLLGGLTGLVIDLFMGTNGLNTIASLATAFARGFVMRIAMGRDGVRDVETPLPSEMGTSRWVRYAVALVGLHCLIFFLFEAMSLHNIGFTLLRTLCSTAATMAVVGFIGALYPSRR